jgi:acyl carrier protein
VCTMKDKIKNIMSAVFDIDKDTIGDDASTTNLENWDSINHMNLVLAIEEEFNIVFDDEEIVQITSLKSIESTLSKKLNA